MPDGINFCHRRSCSDEIGMHPTSFIGSAATIPGPFPIPGKVLKTLRGIIAVSTIKVIIRPVGHPGNPTNNEVIAKFLYIYIFLSFIVVTGYRHVFINQGIDQVFVTSIITTFYAAMIEGHPIVIFSPKVFYHKASILSLYRIEESPVQAVDIQMHEITTHTDARNSQLRGSIPFISCISGSILIPVPCPGAIISSPQYDLCFFKTGSGTSTIKRGALE